MQPSKEWLHLAKGNAKYFEEQMTSCCYFPQTEENGNPIPIKGVTKVLILKLQLLL